MNRRNWTRTALVLVAAALVMPTLPAATYEIDAGHSQASFAVKHLMVTTVRGGFNKVTGKIVWDAKNPSAASAEATIDVTTISTQHADRDNHLKAPDFFDVANHPTMTFKSKKAEAAGPGKLKLTGDLTMRGVTKEVVLDVEGPTPEIRDPWGNTKIGATATTKINRQDFGLKWSKTLETGGLVVSDEVAITIDLELKKVAD
jgi:polyisoprenoid-binding protein YceI